MACNGGKKFFSYSLGITNICFDVYFYKCFKSRFLSALSYCIIYCQDELSDIAGFFLNWEVKSIQTRVIFDSLPNHSSTIWMEEREEKKEKKKRAGRDTAFSKLYKHSTETLQVSKEGKIPIQTPWSTKINPWSIPLVMLQLTKPATDSNEFIFSCIRKKL